MPTFLVCTTLVSKFFIMLVKVFWSRLRILATNYARGRKNFPAKKLSIYILAGKFFPSFFHFFLSPLTLLAPTSCYLRLPVGAVVVATRCLCCCLRILEPGGLEMLNPWVVGPSSYPLDLIERTILILELRGELWHQGILNQKNFQPQVLAGGRSRTAESWIAGPSSYPLDHEGLVERIILDLPDEL